MRKIIFIVFSFIFVCQEGFCVEVRVKNKYGKDERGNSLNERFLVMDNLRIDYRAAFNEEDKKIIGSFLLGCNFGRRGNGGWNIWHFLSVKRKKGNQIISFETQSLIKNIYVLEKTETKGLAEMYWEGEGFLSVKIQKLSIFPQWFFMKIETDFPIYQIVFSAYPGETTGPRERERWCAFPSGSYNLHEGEGKKQEGDYSVALYNRYGGYQDRYGNFLVFLPEEIENCKVRGTYGVEIVLTPKKELKELRFALGYFYDTERDVALGKFFKEISSRIRETLSHLSWQVKMPVGEFRKIIEEIDKLANQEEVKKFLEEAGYEKKKEEAEKYLMENKYREVIDTIEWMEELKEKIYEKLLSSYIK